MASVRRSGFLSAIVLVIVLPPAACVNPGVRARLTQRGLDYVNQLAVGVVSREARQMRIPDQSGSSFGVDYSVSQIGVDGFQLPSSRLQPRAGIGLQWSTSTGRVSLGARWSYTSFFATHRGSLTAQVDGISIAFLLVLGRDGAGRLTVTLGSCSDATSAVSIHFSGDVTVLMQLFHDQIVAMFREKLQGQFCSAVATAIRENAKELIEKIPLTMPVMEKFLVDMRLVSAPHLVSGFLETDHKGEVVWKDDPQECPLHPPSEPPQFGRERMLYLSLSPFLANSMAWAAFSHHYLHYNLTQDMLPPASRGVLNTSCAFVCIGKLIPQIGAKYPNTSVSLHIRATKFPTLTLTSDLIHLVANGSVDFMARQPEGKEAFLLSMNVSLQMNATASFKDELLTGKVEGARAQVAVARSAVGEVKAQELQTLVNTALKMVIVPELNKWGARGQELPLPASLRLVQPSLLLQQDFLVVATDLAYKAAAKLQSPSDPRVKLESSPLLFLSRALQRPHAQYL